MEWVVYGPQQCDGYCWNTFVHTYISTVWYGLVCLPECIGCNSILYFKSSKYITIYLKVLTFLIMPTDAKTDQFNGHTEINKIKAKLNKKNDSKSSCHDAYTLDIMLNTIYCCNILRLFTLGILWDSTFCL